MEHTEPQPSYEELTPQQKKALLAKAEVLSVDILNQLVSMGEPSDALVRATPIDLEENGYTSHLRVRTKGNGLMIEHLAHNFLGTDKNTIERFLLIRAGKGSDLTLYTTGVLEDHGVDTQAPKSAAVDFANSKDIRRLIELLELSQLDQITFNPTDFEKEFYEYLDKLNKNPE